MKRRELIGLAVVVAAYVVVRWYLTRVAEGKSKIPFPAGGMWV